ncbi:GIY-YIG nuclease family protein [Cerasicoccus arenae]|uniref:DUF4357 domain-containing protein n=1 Tax=Cerasicoccus arenae TaxID=424488 RepID=A0A8J3GD66_9BACT|nr:GIY-YIG nuclease family protein [Cerasicoccus arenae]MBK1859352.1 GIY-YIG nuclease family protein [Cerasicoccus arenae]GHB93367.1 hypothetical protein GCM10007047_05970 [Cerasicoccus arenae]
MKTSPKTLQIFLPEGDAAGIRVAELTTRIVQAVAVPRTRLKEFFERAESRHIGVYYLFGGDDESTKPIAYIGQTEDLKQRLKNHDSNKEFWNLAIIVISRTHSFTQAHIRWLEWHSIRLANEAKRFRLDNGNAGSEPFVTEPIRADLEEIFETASLLLESLSFPLFDPLIERLSMRQKEQDLWHINATGVSATATFTTDGIVVHKGSIARLKMSRSAENSFFDKRRERMIQDGILIEKDGGYLFTEDYPFKSPSGAAAIVRARHSNGWIEWKNKSGQTLKEVKRSDADE